MLTIISITNPIYSSADNTSIDCEIKFEEFANQILPFTALKNDVEPHGQQIYADLVAGKYGPIGAYVPPTVKANTANGQPVSSGTQTI